MNTTIIIGNIQIDSGKLNKRNLFACSSPKDALIFHINHPEVDSYIIEAGMFEEDKLQSVIRSILFINSILKIIIIGNPQVIRFDNKYQYELSVFSDPAGSYALLNNLPREGRKANRINWPVYAKFFEKESYEVKYEGYILSISSTGCFINCSHAVPVESGETYIFVIHFKEFEFIVDGEIVRISSDPDENISGFAVRFKNVTRQTEKYIQEIINERLVFELLLLLNSGYEVAGSEFKQKQ